MIVETWKDIKGWEEYYQVSSDGKVRSKDKFVPHWRGGNAIRRGRILSAFNRRGYFEVNLSVNNNRHDISIHRLVAENFIDNPLKLPQVNHKDGNKLNNCVDNLEWVTRSQNVKHAYDMGLSPKRFGEENSRSKLTSYGVIIIKGLIESGMPQNRIAHKFGVSKSTVCMIKKNRVWSQI